MPPLLQAMPKSCSAWSRNDRPGLGMAGQVLGMGVLSLGMEGQVLGMGELNLRMGGQVWE